MDINLHMKHSGEYCGPSSRIELCKTESLNENQLAVVDDIVEKFTTKDEDVTASFCALVTVISTMLDLLKEFDESESAHQHSDFDGSIWRWFPF